MTAADNLYAELTRGVAHAQVRQHLIDEHRAEVLIEAADAVDSGKAPFPEEVKCGASWAARMLRRMAEEEGKGTGTTGGEPTPADRFTAVASPVEYGYLIAIRRDPHEPGRVPVALAQLRSGPAWSPEAASELLLSSYKYVTAPGSRWQQLDGGRYGVRLLLAEDGGR
ncbi:hypothetical protein [Streptomyces sp. A0592]|uniref:hypothetical protein n=1 Tax=Streptomyces sp. A0592 TaxID=2563099 RepID=UPI00109E57D7|nr:hypothetical protein [Streptomyces sp. A0592]THA82771.1 hypothetical protein E6U81_19720 [Streptomyces sp. A0592]